MQALVCSGQWPKAKTLFWVSLRQSRNDFWTWVPLLLPDHHALAGYHGVWLWKLGLHQFLWFYAISSSVSWSSEPAGLSCLLSPEKEATLRRPTFRILSCITGSLFLFSELCASSFSTFVHATWATLTSNCVEALLGKLQITFSFEHRYEDSEHNNIKCNLANGKQENPWWHTVYIPGLLSWFNAWKSSSVAHHINRIGKKNCKIVCINAEIFRLTSTHIYNFRKSQQTGSRRKKTFLTWKASIKSLSQVPYLE